MAPVLALLPFCRECETSQVKPGEDLCLTCLHEELPPGEEIDLIFSQSAYGFKTITGVNVSTGTGNYIAIDIPPVTLREGDSIQITYGANSVVTVYYSQCLV